MESQRSFLFIALMVVTYLLFTQWQQDNTPVIEQPIVSTSSNLSTASSGDFIPESSDSTDLAAITIIKPQAKLITVKIVFLKFKL